jgi:hypothetical protein
VPGTLRRLSRLARRAALLVGRKPWKWKCPSASPEADRGGDHRAGAGYRDHRKARVLDPGHRAGTGVGHGRGAGIGDQGHLLALLQHADHQPGGGLFIVFVQGHQAGLDAEGIEEALAVAGVLAGHRIHRPQHGQGAQAHVLQVSQGRGHHIQ